MVEPLQVADWFNGLVILAAAALLLMVGDRGRVQRWLAALLMYRGVENVLITFRFSGPEWLYVLSQAWTVGLAGLWFLFALVFATTYGKQKWSPWFYIILSAAAALVWFRSVPGFAYDVVDGVRVQRWPLVAFVGWIFEAARVAAAAWIASVAARHPQATVQRAGALIAAGMIGYSWWVLAQQSGVPAFCAFVGNTDCVAAASSTGRWITALIWGLTLAVASVGLWRTGGTARTLARWLIGALFLALVLWAAIIVELQVTDGLLGEARFIVLSAWILKATVLLQPVLLVYGILRYQILGLDLKMRWTVQASSLVAMFVAAFVVASQVAGAFIEDAYGSSVVGALATAAMLLAIVPLKRIAARVGQAATPGAQKLETMDAAGRAVLYREQLEFAWADGGIDKRERLRLESLRTRLDLPADVALAMETKVATT